MPVQNKMKVYYDFEESWIESFTKTVGPTNEQSKIYSVTSTYFNVTADSTVAVPQAADTKIYISDVAGAGGASQGYAVDNPWGPTQMASAITALGSTFSGGAVRTTICLVPQCDAAGTQIAFPEWVEITLVAGHTLASTRNMQCGTLTVTQCKGRILETRGNATYSFSLAGSQFINNIWFDQYWDTGQASLGAVTQTGDGVKFTNCALTSYVLPASSIGTVSDSSGLIMAGAIDQNEVRNTFFSGSTCVRMQGAAATGDDYYNCIFRVRAKAQGLSSSGSLYTYDGSYGAFYLNGPDGPRDLDCTDCLFITGNDGPAGIYAVPPLIIVDISGANQDFTISFTTSVFIGFQDLLWINLNSNTLATSSISTSGCLTQGVSAIAQTDGLTFTYSSPTNFTLTNTDSLDPDTPPLFVNQNRGFVMSELIDGTGLDPTEIELLRLQIEGKEIPSLPGNKYAFSSPLYLNSPALTPFTETTTFSTVIFNKSLEFDYDPNSLTITPQAINPVEMANIEGDMIYGYDGYRRVFNLDFSDASTYASSNNAWKIEALQRDTGPKLFYPLGDDQDTTLFISPCEDDGSITEGEFDEDTLVLTPTGLGSNNAMIQDHWAGWWVLLVNGLDSGYYRIASNTASSLTLEDPLGIGIATGTVDFFIDHIVVKTDLAPLTVSQQKFTHFVRGGAWREVDRDTTVPFEYQGFSFNLFEIKRLIRGS